MNGNGRAGVAALLINSFEFQIGRMLKLEFVIRMRGSGGVVYMNTGSSVMLVLRNAALFCWRATHSAKHY